MYYSPYDLLAMKEEVGRNMVISVRDVQSYPNQVKVIKTKRLSLKRLRLPISSSL